MNIIFFTHPDFFNSRSMRQYSQMLYLDMKKRGHTVSILKPRSFFYNIPFPSKGKKWLGYLDQYLIFPLEVKRKLKKFSNNTLCVITDQALGPWVPLMDKRPSVIHCHDFMALSSALGKNEENKVSFTGKVYQQFILNGFSKGKNFISISNKTKNDLHQYLKKDPQISLVVYNQIPEIFRNRDKYSTRITLNNYLKLLGKNFNINNGYLLHVGANVWYKNKLGVLEIYDAFRKNYPEYSLPLLMIGEPDNGLKNLIDTKSWKGDVLILDDVSLDMLANIYCGATIFLFPSLAEGFGWPIAEAMACGCPVITTQEPPMSEVGGTAAFYIPKKSKDFGSEEWANLGAEMINNILSLSYEDLSVIISNGIDHCKQFDPDEIMDQVESYYEFILKNR